MNFDHEVAKGAEWLDANFPGWERTIDAAALEMHKCDSCILGQVAKDFVEKNLHTIYMDYGTIVRSAAGGDDSYGWAISHGFDTGDAVPVYWDADNKAESWSVLGETWLSLIKERFNSGVLSDDV